MQTDNALSSPSARFFVAFTLPPVAALLLSSAASTWSGVNGGAEQAGGALFLGGLGLVSWLIGFRWYSLPELGLRGGRPLYASIGFAALGWVTFLLARLFLVSSNEELLVSPDFGRAFVYLILFEAFAVQLWAFGLTFRTLAAWRGPLTAAVSSGVLFGAIAFLFFEEAFVNSPTSLLYFLLWGLLYGIIRLRTGSILGSVVVQAMQSLTAWYILLPPAESSPAVISQFQNLYLVAGILYLIFIWRLWPREEEDYRV